MVQTRWQVYRRQDPNLLSHLCKVRGLNETELAIDFTTGLHDPNLLPDMAKARSLIVAAKKNQQRVTIFGDYDADGTPAAALLSSLFMRLGVEHEVIIPTRAHGYGLKLEDVEAVSKHSQLLITVDNGITALKEMSRAKELGLKTIILDHHLPAAELPTADAVVDPYVETNTYPFTHLCGCALAYKLVEALAADFPAELSEGFRKWLLDLVAISTVADMMHMTGENRVLVHYGLQVLKKTRRPGLQALIASAGLDPSNLTVGALGFALGPRLNATGRIGDNRPAFDLLMSPTIKEAIELAEDIERSNKERQALVTEVTVGARKKLLAQNSQTDHCFIIIGDGWPTGVLGLVAGKLSVEYNRPVLVLSAEGEQVSGSARSVGPYSLIDGLHSQKKVLTRYGGHRQAAGLALTVANVPKLIDGLKAHAKAHLPAEALVPSYVADALLSEAELGFETVSQCDQLQPFGLNNSQPLFVIEKVKLSSPKVIGQKSDHVKWSAQKGEINFEVIGFGLAARAKESNLAEAHLLGYLEKNTWRDRKILQLRLVDYLPSHYPIELID